MKHISAGRRAISRRKFLANTSAAALATAAGLTSPTIIGRVSAATASDAFKGEAMAVCVWSGNYQLVFDEYVVKPFNDRYGTKVSVVGGWDQHVNLILAAPADRPPFDLTEVDEYTTIGGLENKLWLPTDRSKMPGMKDVMPYFLKTRAADALPFGVPFGGGVNMLLVNRKAGEGLDSWQVLWDPRFSHKITLDSGAWWYTLAVTAVAQGLSIDTMFDYPTGTNKLLDRIGQLKVAKWYRDGSEEANIMQQESALISMAYVSDAWQFVNEDPKTYYVSFPKEGLSGWTNWFVKVRGTPHADLADLFSAYILEKETQNRFLANSFEFGSLQGLTIPDHSRGYLSENLDLEKRVALMTIDGWRKLLPNFDAVNEQWKLVVRKTTSD
jgi:spermidine/putrescine transport system substrate-binding protein